MPGLEWNWLDDTYYSYCLLQPQEGGTIFITPVTLMRKQVGSGCEVHTFFLSWAFCQQADWIFLCTMVPSAGHLGLAIQLLNDAAGSSKPLNQLSANLLLTGTSRPLLDSTNAISCLESQKFSKDCPPRHHKQYTCWLQTVVMLSLQGPAPPGSPKKKLNPPVLSQLLGTQNLVYTNPGQRQNRKTRDNII